MNIRHSLRPVLPRLSIAAAIFLLLATPPASAQNTPAATTAGPERESIDFEGTRIVFPKGEADVVELLKPALQKFREERQKVVEAEARGIASGLSGAETKENVRKLVAFYTAREPAGDQFDVRWTGQTLSLMKLAKAWQDWSGGISELHLWRGRELVPFQIRPDGADNEEGFSYKFPQNSFGKNGASFSLHPGFLAPMIGRDVTLKLTEETKPLRLDLPLFYKSGQSPAEIASYGKTFLAELPAFMHREYGRGFGLAAALPRWTLENMFLGEIEAVFVDRRTARETALAEGLARLLLFAEVLRQEGQEKVAAKFPTLFPFEIIGAEKPDPVAVVATVEKLDPLAPVARAKINERIYARNLIALTLVEIAQKDDTQAPILHKLKKAGVAVPAGGFTMDSFIAAVDTAYGEKGYFRRAVAAKKVVTLEQLRQTVKLYEEHLKKQSEPLAVKAPEAPAAMPGRETAKFGNLTVTFPPVLRGAVESIGPEYAQLLARAREEVQKIKVQERGPTAEEMASADIAAFRAYGLEPDTGLLRNLAALVDALQDGTLFTRWFVSGDRMQIWIKEDMVEFLKGGGKIPDFALSPNGETIIWNFKFEVSEKDLDKQKMTAGSAEARAELTREIDTIPRMVYPIILKRTELPGKLDDTAAVATAIRAVEGQIFAAIRATTESPEDAVRAIAALMPQSQQETRWFVFAHEISELAVIATVIRSADRRWFCDGLANWIALRDVDRRFGQGKGADVFAKFYDAEKLRKEAANVDLFAWPTAEDVKNGSRPEVANSLAHYYFATLVMEKACAGQGPDFVKKWLDEIRKTPLNRANAGTVLTAYQTITGKDLQSIIGEVVK